MVRISIIMPTLGRETLSRAVQSALDAMSMDDELIVVSDGPSRSARSIMSRFDSERVFYLETRTTHQWGCYQYDFGSLVARGQFLMFATDDDVLTPRACDIVWKGVANKLGPHVFAMDHRPQGRLLHHSIKECEVGAHQIVVPNVPGLLAKWSDNTSPTNDHAYLMATLKNWKVKEPEFHSQVIAIMLQHNMGRLP